MLLVAAALGTALAAGVGERERLARIDVDVWVVRADRAPGEALGSLAACSNSESRIVLPGRVLPISVRGPVIAFCVQIHGKLTPEGELAGMAWVSSLDGKRQEATPIPDLVADLEVRDSSGRWRLIQTIQMEEFSWTSESGGPEATGIVSVEYSKMEAINVMAATEIGAAALPCTGTLRLVVRRRGSNFDEVDGLYHIEPRLYRSSLYQCPRPAGPRNPDPAELLEGG